MLRIRIQNAKTQTAGIKRYKLSETPITINAIEKKRNATCRGILLSKRDTNHPEMGRPINELTGIASSKLPSSASFRLKIVLMVGMREAHVEKQNPERKK